MFIWQEEERADWLRFLSVSLVFPPLNQIQRGLKNKLPCSPQNFICKTRITILTLALGVVLRMKREM